MRIATLATLLATTTLTACAQPAGADPDAVNVPVKPRVVTQPVPHDTDDPAIWINRADPAKSLVIGTDKATAGGLYAFDLAGKIVGQTPTLKRPNNVDIIAGQQDPFCPRDGVVAMDVLSRCAMLFRDRNVRVVCR